MDPSQVAKVPVSGPGATALIPTRKNSEKTPQKRWPTDPWEKDFRVEVANMSIEELRDKIEGCFGSVITLSDDELRFMQSKEFAERTRPYMQMSTLLRERGLEEEVGSIIARHPVAEGHGHVIKMLSQKAPDLVDRYKTVWHLEKGGEFPMDPKAKF